MVGPKPQVKANEILDQLILYDIFDGEKLKNRSNVVWKEICTSLQDHIKPLNLYLMVKQDRHNLLANYKHTKGLNKSLFIEDEEKNDDNCTDSDSELEEDSDSGTKKIKIDDYTDSDSEIDENSVLVTKKREIGCKKKIKFDIELSTEQ